MNKHERLTEILDYLKSNKKLSVEEACDIFNSSARLRESIPGATNSGSDEECRSKRNKCA